MIKPVHPFPARMAPELALNHLERAKGPIVVLDPMTGSGTVLRHAAGLGHACVGLDTDPLAVLMSRVWTTPASDEAVAALAATVTTQAKARKEAPRLPWIDDDPEALKFVEYWFAPAQRAELRKLSAVLAALPEESTGAANVLRVALSRIIITKDRGASLARDVSHSRPHKAWQESDYDVFDGFEKSVRQVRKLLVAAPPPGRTTVDLGDARSMGSVKTGSIDLVLTSPPYLNALDYMRGHRMSLIWLGHRLKDLRTIRTEAIGTEKGLRTVDLAAEEIRATMCTVTDLSSAHQGMVTRYAHDVQKMMAEMARVTRPGGRVVAVVGNSCLRGTFVRNSDAVARAGTLAGLTLLERTERDLPSQNRYLPIANGGGEALNKRMRTETILHFAA